MQHFMAFVSGFTRRWHIEDTSECTLRSLHYTNTCSIQWTWPKHGDSRHRQQSLGKLHSILNTTCRG